MTMNKVDINAAIREKFNELSLLGIIKFWDDVDNVLYINRDELSRILGYTLVVNTTDCTCSEPVFKKLIDVIYSINVTPYLSDVVPFSSLSSYVLTEIRDSCFSL